MSNKSLLWLGVLLTACDNDAVSSMPNHASQNNTVTQGVIREYEVTATYGTYEMRMDGGMSMGRVYGYFLNDQFLGPTLVADVGDTIRVTLHNETSEAMGLHPHGVHYDKKNEGLSRLAQPGASVTYEWQATNGPGTFLYHSHEMDGAMLEYQGMAGVLGVLVIRDPSEWQYIQPTSMINYVMMNTYLPWTVLDANSMHVPAGHSRGGNPTPFDGGSPSAPLDVSKHNHTMVVQQVSWDAKEQFATETKPLLTAKVDLDETVRVNVVGFGDAFHTFHSHGYTWQDPYTGQVLDTKTVGPAESFYFYWPKMENPGLWMVHCHVDSHMHMMTTYVLVSE